MSLIAHARRLYEQYQDAVPAPRPRLPEVIQFPVNDICNSRCQMCFIWKRKRQQEITPDEVRVALSNPLFRRVRAVGINGGEPTLRKDLADLADAACAALPSLTGISLITNGLKPALVIQRIDALAAACRRHGVQLDVMVSIDGVGEVHDRVRGRPGNFEAACAVLDFLTSLGDAVTRRIGCTIIKDNVFDLENVLAWAQAKGHYARFRLGIPHQRLYSRDTVEPFVLDDAQRYHVAAFLDLLYYDYETDEARRAFYRSLRDQVIYGAPRASGCHWKNKGVTLLPTGDLAYCAVHSMSLGNILDNDAQDLFWNNVDHLADIVQNKCASCLHDYDGIAQRAVLVRRYARRVLERQPRPIRTTVRRARGLVRALSDRRRVAAAASALAAQRVLRPLGRRALLIGWYGTETLGDKAILGGVTRALRAASPAIRIDVASLEPYVTRETSRQMPDLGIARVVSLETAKDEMASGIFDTVVVAGGPLMAPVAEVVDLVEVFAAARRSGARTVIAGCGVGPLGTAARNDAIKLLFELADMVVVRDRQSADLVKNTLGVRRQLAVALDPALPWIEENLPGSPRGREDVILLALRDWPVSEYASIGYRSAKCQRLKDQAERQLLGFVDCVVESYPHMKIVPFCMQTLSVGGDDRAFYRRLFAERPRVLDNLVQRHQGPAQAIEAFVAARAALTMRFHGAVFAIATKTPFLALDYTMGGKVRGLLTDVGALDRLRDIRTFDGRAAARDIFRQDVATPNPERLIAATRQTLTRAFQETAPG